LRWHATKVEKLIKNIKFLKGEKKGVSLKEGTKKR